MHNRGFYAGTASQHHYCCGISRSRRDEPTHSLSITWKPLARDSQTHTAGAHTDPDDEPAPFVFSEVRRSGRVWYLPLRMSCCNERATGQSGACARCTKNTRHSSIQGRASAPHTSQARTWSSSQRHIPLIVCAISLYRQGQRDWLCWPLGSVLNHGKPGRDRTCHCAARVHRPPRPTS
jgi:hypothetical protein